MSENYSDQRINAVLSITEDGGYMKHLREIVMQLRAERDEALTNWHNETASSRALASRLRAERDDHKENYDLACGQIDSLVEKLKAALRWIISEQIYYDNGWRNSGCGCCSVRVTVPDEIAKTLKEIV